VRPSPIRAVLFDFGGVVLRTEYQAPREHLAERLNLTYEDLNKIVFESESGRLASVGAITTDQHWAALVHRLGQAPSETGTIREEFFAGDVIDRPLVDYIRDLRHRCKTGMISNGWADLREYIVRNQVDDAFDVMVISAEVGVLKPEPKIYQVALEELGVDAHESAFVDDTIGNIEAAIGMGMRGILFRSHEQIMREVETLLS
jgi:epoxide hydrolase-like predicted phosphatase